MVVYRDPVRSEHGFERFCRVTNYEDGAKIDYTVWPTGLLRRVTENPRLPDYLDDGYRVLLDKDRLTEHLMAPTFTAYVPSPPTEKDYRSTIDAFFNDSIYVAKNIFRDNLFLLTYCLDEIMKGECLRKMLEWRMEIDHDWSVPAGARGKGLKRLIAKELWADLESTWVGAGSRENWRALWTTIAVFRKVASEVGDHLGYPYPDDLESQVVAYLREIEDMDKSTR
jgi:aminoglycoside 6-adenylyltransferase